MPTNFERERALREANGLAAESLRLDELGREPLQWLARAVGASQVLLYRYDVEGMVSGRGGSLLGPLQFYCADLFAEDPLQRALFKLQCTPPIVDPRRLDGLDERGYRRSAAYQEFYRKYEMEHLLGGGLTQMRYGARGMNGLLFSRAGREQPFDGEDRKLLMSAMPAFQTAVRRSDRLGREQGLEPQGSFAARHHLTAAESEVLALMAQGLSNKEIAQRRYVSLETVRTHVQRVLAKLGVATRTQAALAFERART
jgi:DNA-binding CsgD family transcriptional regulator